MKVLNKEIAKLNRAMAFIIQGGVIKNDKQQQDRLEELETIEWLKNQIIGALGEYENDK